MTKEIGKLQVPTLRYIYALKEIADYLKIHYTTVSKAIKQGLTKKWYFKTWPPL